MPLHIHGRPSVDFVKAFFLNMGNNKKDGVIFTTVSNGAAELIELERPYRVSVKIVGTTKMLMHCWNNQSVQEKADSKKNSVKKKTDDLESYVLRNEKGFIVIPGLNFCAAIAGAAKSFADPVSPRKSLRDRVKAIVVPEEEYGILNGGVKTWDMLDARRVVIQRAGITRTRPCFFEGWKIEFKLMVLEPEFLQPETLFRLIENAGKFQALGDFRPTFGRFRIESFTHELI